MPPQPHGFVEPTAPPLPRHRRSRVFGLRDTGEPGSNSDSESACCEAVERRQHMARMDGPTESRQQRRVPRPRVVVTVAAIARNVKASTRGRINESLAHRESTPASCTERAKSATWRASASTHWSAESGATTPSFTSDVMATTVAAAVHRDNSLEGMETPTATRLHCFYAHDPSPRRLPHALARQSQPRPAEPVRTRPQSGHHTATRQLPRTGSIQTRS